MKEGMEEDNNGVEVEITWDDDLSMLGANADWGPTAHAHRSAIKLLQQAISKGSTKCKQFVDLLESRVSDEVRIQLGSLKQIIQERVYCSCHELGACH
jgi:hypothetical protein